jgi:hypothetical protein
VSLLCFGASFLPNGASQIFDWLSNLVGVSNQVCHSLLSLLLSLSLGMLTILSRASSHSSLGSALEPRAYGSEQRGRSKENSQRSCAFGTLLDGGAGGSSLSPRSSSSSYVSHPFLLNLLNDFDPSCRRSTFLLSLTLSPRRFKGGLSSPAASTRFPSSRTTVRLSLPPFLPLLLPDPPLTSQSKSPSSSSSTSSGVSSKASKPPLSPRSTSQPAAMSERKRTRQTMRRLIGGKRGARGGCGGCIRMSRRDGVEGLSIGF